MKKEIIKNLKENNTIEQLQENGKINIDYINDNLNLLIEVLKEEYNMQTELQTHVRGQYLVYIKEK